MTTLYRAHGLVFDSEVELPYDHVTDDQLPDATIRFGAVSDADDSALDVGVLCQATPSQCWVDVPSTARFEVRDGSEVVVEPAAGADPAAVAAFLTSSVLGALIHQRHGAQCDGLLLEAAIVADGDCAIAIVSSAGNGQSALAASLVRNGMTFLGDDLASVSLIGGQPMVHIGSVEARLWPDTLREAEIDPSQFEQVHSGIFKRRVPLRHASLEFDALPLVGVIVVGESATDELETDESSGRERFVVLSKHTWRRRMVTAVGYRNEHFGQLAALASTVRVARITRPRHEATFDEAREAAQTLIDAWVGADRG